LARSRPRYDLRPSDVPLHDATTPAAIPHMWSLVVEMPGPHRPVGPVDSMWLNMDRPNYLRPGVTFPPLAPQQGCLIGSDDLADGCSPMADLEELDTDEWSNHRHHGLLGVAEALLDTTA
jgi:hypothetical protein